MSFTNKQRANQIMKQNNQHDRILLVEDDQHLKQFLAEELEEIGFAVQSASSAEEAYIRIGKWEPDLVVSDLKLPDADGLELLQWIQTFYNQPGFLMITAFGSIPQAVQALKSGADDFLTKPLDFDHLEICVKRVLENRKLKKEVLKFRALKNYQSFQGMIGQSQAMRILFDQIQNVAQAHGPVLIQGESGVGKELVAKALHNLSSRYKGPFLAINCAGIPAELLESEFFGHEEGAFTGAVKKRQGLFQRAHKGMILLDEIGEMPIGLQAKLLRTLQDGSFRPVGANQEQIADVRVLCSTNQDLQELTKNGSFRMDLYYRLETFSLRVPPLRERDDDIQLLAAHFIDNYNLQLGKEITGFTEEALSHLKGYSFPGNVRELQNIIERAVTFCHKKEMDMEHLPTRIRQNSYAYTSVESLNSQEEFWSILNKSSSGLPSMKEMEKLYLDFILREVEGNKRRAAAILGISRRTLYRRLTGEE